MSLFKRITAPFLGTLLCLGLAQAAPDDNLPRHRDGVILLRFADGLATSQQNAILNAIDGALIKKIGNGTHMINVGSGRVTAALAILQRLGGIKYVEPDYQSDPLNELSGPDTAAGTVASPSAPLAVHPSVSLLSTAAFQPQVSIPGATPNDPFLGLQWAVNNTGQSVNGTTGVSGADQSTLPAWGVSRGTNSVVVAVLDVGVQYSHPDLLTNMWNNPGGINSCPAGTHGYNVLTGSCDPMDDDTQYGGHGSHVAGILGATGNDAAGVSGINWTTSIMAIKWVDHTDSGYTSDLITAMDWVINAKKAGVNVRIVNDSQTWPGTAVSQALSDEIDLLTANDILFVTAAGNTAQDNDTVPRYPCSYNRPGEICVAASDQSDNLWISSDYGPNTVQLAAGGVNIYSTKRLSNYGYISGTSMAAPQVAGTAALILSRGYLSVADLKATILNNVDVLPSLAGMVSTSGRLNVCKALPGCSSASTATPANTEPPVITGMPASGSVLAASTGAWSGAPASFTYQWYRCSGSGSNCSPISGATSQLYGALASADTGATLAVTVTAANSSGSASAQSAVSSPIASVTSPFALNSSITDGQSISDTVTWQVNPAQAVNFAQFYIDGVLTQTVSSSPYKYNQSTTGVLDTSTLSNGSHVLGIRALSTDNETYAFYGATVTAGAVPQNTALPVISGTPALGQTLTTSKGTWTNNPTQFTYQWTRCNASGASCSAISGAISSSYLVSTADSGSELRATVTATNGAGSNSATSAATGVVGGGVSVTTSSLPSGQVSSSYSATLAASGGTAPYTWSITTGSLPSGLSLSSSSGAISGTPTASGTSSFTVRVTDSNSLTASAQLSITIDAASGGGFIMGPFNSVQGSAVPSVSAAFPSNNTAGRTILAFVRMSTTTQTVAISDTEGNVYQKAVSQAQTTDGHQIYLFFAPNIRGGPNTVTATFSGTNNHPWLAIYEIGGLSANPLDTVASAQGSGSSVNTGPTPMTHAANEFVFAGAGFNSPSFTGTVTAGSGFTLAQQDTNTSRAANETMTTSTAGTPSGTFSLSSSANWSGLIATFLPAGTFTPPSITTTSLPNAQQNVSYSATLSASGGTSPYTWSVVAGSLPAGLTLGASTGTISGTPTSAGPYTFTVQLADAASQTATQPLSISVSQPAAPTITTSSLPGAQQGVAYSATVSASGGTPPYTWSVISGSLPAGMALAASSGTISGTPTTPGTSNFTVQVEDASQTATQALSITVSPSGSGISIVQSTSVQGSAGRSVTAAFQASNTPGNTILVFVRMSTTTQTVSIADTAGNSYISAVSQAQNTDGHQIHLFYAKNVGGGANTVTATFSASNNHPWLAIYELSGLSATAPLDQTASAQGNSSSVSTGATTATQNANEFVFVGAGFNSPSFKGTVSAGAGYTLGQQNTNTSRAATEYQTVSSTGSYTGTFALSGSANWSALVATFTP